MKYYIVFTSDHLLKFITTDKRQLEAFIKQRKAHKYDVKKVDENDLPKKIREIIEEGENQLSSYNDILLCSDEEEYFLEGLNDFFQQARCRVEQLMEQVKLIKFDKHEEETVKEMLELVLEWIEMADGVFFETFNETDYNIYLKIDKMLELIISQFN